MSIDFYYHMLDMDVSGYFVSFALLYSWQKVGGTISPAILRILENTSSASSVAFCT